MKRNIRWLLLLASVMLLSACGFAEKDAITTVLEARDKAVSSRDIDAFSSLLANDFMENNRDKASRIEQETALFQEFEKIQMHSHGRKIIVHGPHAECEQSYSLRVLRDGDWRALVQRERITLKKSAAGWKITGGI